MTSEEIFKEVLKSSEFQTIFQISRIDLEQEEYSIQSKYPVVEIIKEILKGQENHRSKDQIFQTIQKQIIQL